MSYKVDSIRLKLAKAKSLAAEVDVLMQHQFYATVINRLYYSCFHTTKALLLTKDLVPKTHSGVVSMLHQYFVQNGSFDIGHAAFFSRLMQERIEDDYNDFVDLNEEEVKAFLGPGAAYIFYVNQLVDSYLQNASL